MRKTSSPEQLGQSEIYGSYRGAETSQLDALARSSGAGQPEMVLAAREEGLFPWPGRSQVLKGILGPSPKIRF